MITKYEVYLISFKNMPQLDQSQYIPALCIDSGEIHSGVSTVSQRAAEVENVWVSGWTTQVPALVASTSNTIFI